MTEANGHLEAPAKRRSLMDAPGDDTRWDRRNHAVMLDRARRDLLAWIDPNAVEAFSYLYLDAFRLERIRSGTGDALLEWLDNNLILSASRKGWRGESMERILSGREERDSSMGRQLEVPTKGLKHREATQ